MPSTYTPKPIDTETVDLSPDLEQLTEQLAEHAHDLWAVERFKQGWTYGKNRDDEALRHPCLVPYNDLPESEKTFDRATAIGTLKAMIALGYSIQKHE